MITNFTWIYPNGDGLKERFLNGTVQLFNKLSAEEANSILTKLNELVAAANFSSIPLFPFFALKFKGDGNEDLLNLEVGDIVHGFYDADTIWDNAVYMGGDPLDKANYKQIYPEIAPLVILDGGLILAAAQSDFELPDGAICENVHVNEAFYTNTDNAAFITYWQQTDNIVTINPIGAINNRVVIQYRPRLAE